MLNIKPKIYREATEQHKNGNNTSNDKHDQAVCHGSVEMALDEKFIAVDSLLEWLAVRKDFNFTHELAYNAICKRQHPDTHYLKDGVHIMAKIPGLAHIALTYGLKPSVKDRKEGENFELWNYIHERIMNLRMSESLRQKCILLHKGTGTVKFLRDNLVILYGAGFRPEIAGINNEQVNQALLRTDRTDKLRSSGMLAKQLLARLTYLQQHAPNYYAEVAYKHYHKVVVRLQKEKLLTNLKQEELSLIDGFFQNIIDRRLLSYDKLCYNVAIMTPDIAGYVLGFPIESFIPSEEQIHTAVTMLKEKGKIDYCAHVKKLTESCGLPVGPFTDTKFSLANEQDVFGEDIANYVAFDIVAFRDADHVYRFTRMEFKQILESKKNPYTNMWLPSSIIETIKSRVSTARHLGLPIARTLKEHLDCLEQGQFFASDTPAAPVTDDLVSVPDLVDSDGEVEDDIDDEEEEEEIDDEEVPPLLPLLAVGTGDTINFVRDVISIANRFGAGELNDDPEHYGDSPDMVSPVSLRFDHTMIAPRNNNRTHSSTDLVNILQGISDRDLQTARTEETNDYLDNVD